LVGPGLDADSPRLTVLTSLPIEGRHVLYLDKFLLIS